MEWISTRRRLPDIEEGQGSSDLVLIVKRGTIKTAQLCRIPAGRYGATYVWIEYDLGAIIDVDYWMPLPEPPEEDEHE